MTNLEKKFKMTPRNSDLTKKKDITAMSQSSVKEEAVTAVDK